MTVDFDRDRSVGADMERVFGAAPVLTDGTRAQAVAETGAAPRPLVPPAAVEPPARSRRWLLLAAPALAALFVAALAVRFALTLVPGNTAAPVAERPAPTAYVAAATLPRAVTDPGVEDSGDRAETLSADDFGPAPVDDRPALRPAVAVGRDEDTERSPAPVRTRRAAAARPAVQNDCPPGADEDHCIYRDVIGADRRLRAAYDEATRAGVPTDELIAVRRRWDRARAISLNEPDETIRRYDRLAERLDDLTRTEQ